MPGLNGTGPRGMGPMTGRGLGWCNPYGGRIGYYPPYYGYGYPADAGVYGMYRYGSFGFGPGFFGGGRGQGFARGRGRGRRVW